MNSELEAAERAEFIQSVKALLIPLCLFLACVVAAAGTFLIYNHEPVGWAFATVAAITILTCIVWLIRFQNSYRARGILKHGLEAETLEATATTGDDEANESSTSVTVDSANSSQSDTPLTVVDQSNVVEFKPTKHRLNQ